MSLSLLIGAGIAVVAVIAVVIGFVVLAGKDKHTEGDTLIRPITQADKVALDSALRLAASAEEAYLVEHGSYVNDLTAAGFRSNGSQGQRCERKRSGVLPVCDERSRDRYRVLRLRWRGQLDPLPLTVSINRRRQ